MDIGIVRVPVDDPRVGVHVSMRLAGGVAQAVRVLMVDVVNVPVLMP